MVQIQTAFLSGNGTGRSSSLLAYLFHVYCLQWKLDKQPAPVHQTALPSFATLIILPSHGCYGYLGVLLGCKEYNLVTRAKIAPCQSVLCFVLRHFEWQTFSTHFNRYLFIFGSLAEWRVNCHSTGWHSSKDAGQERVKTTDIITLFIWIKFLVWKAGYHRQNQWHHYELNITNTCAIVPKITRAIVLQMLLVQVPLREA